MLLGGVMHYGAEHFVSSWFERALIVRDILKITKARLKREPSLRDQFKGEPDAKEWLCGVRLPEIYKLFSGKKFSLSRSSNRLNETGGMGFVLAAHEAMGLGKLGAATVSTHWNKAKKRRARQHGRI